MIKCALTLQSYVRTGGINQSQFVLHVVMTCYSNDISQRIMTLQDGTVRYDVTVFFLLNLLNLAS